MPGDRPLPPDASAEPESLVVALDTGDRIHYLDWGGPTEPGGDAALPALVLVHGLGATCWTWSPVARRLRRIARILAPDLRGHGWSEAPAGGYDLDSLGVDLLTVMVANGLGPDAGGPPAVIAGHGFGAMVAVAAAAREPDAVAGLALVDGGWEDVSAGGLTVEEFVDGVADPPEVLRSMDAYLADRRAYDPASWDADQERAARAAVEEKHAGHVAPVIRRHALAASVASMLAYRPDELLPRVRCPVLVAVAGSAATDDESARDREMALADALRFLADAGPVRVVRFEGAGHNLMRYRPDDLSVALAGLLVAAG